MAPVTPWTPGNYPPTRRSDHIDVYESAANGQVGVPDPYHWLENRTDEAEKWVTAQRLFARSYLDKNPDQQKLRTLLRSCMDYPKVASASPSVSWHLTESFPVLATHSGRRWTMVLVL